MNNNISDYNLKTLKNKEHGLKVIKDIELEVEDITNQIKDYFELLDFASKANRELDVDPEWVVKAQFARRAKLHQLKQVKEWVGDVPNKSMNNRLILLEQNLESLKAKLEKEKSSRSNALDEYRRQIGFTMRAVRELYKLIKFVANKANVQAPNLVTQTQITWIDDILNKNPKALLLKND